MDSSSQRDHYAKKKTRREGSGGTRKGIQVEPLTFNKKPFTKTTCLFHILMHSLCQHGFTGGFVPAGVFHCSQIQSPSPPVSPLRQGGPAAVPSEHGIASIRHSCKRCLLPEIYTIIARASMSTHTVAER